MEETLGKRILVKIGFAILAVALLDLVFLNYLVLEKSKVKNQEEATDKTRAVDLIASSPSAIASPTSESKSQPETKTVETKTLIETPNQSGSGQVSSQTIVQTTQKEIFIPIGSGSTNSKSYVDLNGLEVTIDTNKYSAIESAVFEASIWVQDGNGKTYAQLYNASDKRPVWFSEISTISAKGVLTTSGKITLEKGARTYRVQAKTDMDAYAAHVDSARIKIILK